MLLKSLTLHNIRSYKDAKVDFPEGTLLLSGDIGAGKSTILLAIEFCIFGFRPKVLDGSTLLRHGTNEAYAELEFSIGSDNITVRRSVKRTSRGIAQQPGFIITNNQKKDLTPVELKAHIISLLGYPAEMLSRSKDQIFRYTVYTPQEAMKRIISEDPESRLEVLRKVFNIDRYSRIRNNMQVYIRKLKDDSKILLGKMDGIAPLRKQLEEHKNKRTLIKEQYESLFPMHKQLTEKVKKQKGSLTELEKSISILNELKRKDAAAESDFGHALKLHIDSKRQHESIAEKIRALEEKLGTSPIPDRQAILDRISLLEKKIKAKEEEISSNHKDAAAKNAHIANSRKIIERIVSIDSCPTCEQMVSNDHKSRIHERENRQIEQHQRSMEKLSAAILSLKQELELLKTKEKEARENISRMQVIILKKKQLEELKNQEKTLISQQSETKKRIGELNASKIILKKKIEDMKDITSGYEEQKRLYDSYLTEEHKLALKANSLEKEAEGIDGLITQTEENIAQKEKAKSEHKELSKKIEYLDGFFLKLMTTMEQHVFYSIANEFDTLFREWVSMLIDEEHLQVRLDEQFTPLITQNGHDTDISNLSGGEKTSVALAYRLSLNKVINDLISTIRTSGLIILDEPTDGFSDNQLDKVREVLDQLNSRQTIIVSHELKIESFVSSIIRITKDEHVSKVIS